MSICKNHQYCIDKAIKTAEDVCLDQNLQLTKVRKDILRLIWTSHVPLKAYDLLDLIKADNAAAKPITIYRALDFLLENKLIHKLESLNSFLGCTHPFADHNCYFIICNNCHIAKEICSTELLKTLYTSLKQQKFTPQHITLEIQGICQDCAN